MQRIHSMKRWICIYLVLAALIALCPAAAAKDVFVWETVYTMADPQMQKSRINMTMSMEQTIFSSPKATALRPCSSILFAAKKRHISLSAVPWARVASRVATSLT